jgi:RpiR family carbohydrate utilization transcriptional regulator
LSLLATIEARLPDLRDSERKVAEQVLENPEFILRQALAGLAAQAGVSEPTVIRFCRAVDCDGFSDFKLRLAQSLAAGTPYVHQEVTADDNVSTVIEKIVRSSMNTIASLKDRLDPIALERATWALVGARRIDCFGVGASAIVALDAHQKLMRLGVASSVLLEGHSQTLSACTLQAGDVALIFSFTGQIRDILRTAGAARNRGAFVIAVTRSGSALSRIASLTIAVDAGEDTFVYAPMATRLAHMACVDILATNVAIARGGDMPALFQRLKDSLADQHVLDAPPAAAREPAENEPDPGAGLAIRQPRSAASGTGE